MSGRSGYRKTSRKQSRPRPLIERVHELNDRCGRKFPGQYPNGIRLGFILPRELAGFVSDGNHGSGVDVFHGFVHVMHVTPDECYLRAARFFGAVAKDRSFTLTASLKHIADPTRCRGVWLTIAGNALVVSGGMYQPRAFSTRAA